LGQPVALIDGVKVTAKDLIRYIAHVEDAVHAGTPDSDSEKVISKFGVTFMKDGNLTTGSMEVLKAVARAVVRGLEPLRQDILQSS
jgi:hypothetical protein